MRYHLRHGVHGNSKANTGAAAAGRVNCGVDAYQLAHGIQQRPARIAGINRGVGLNHPADGTVTGRLNFSIQCADNPHRQGGVEAEGIANRHDLAADREL